MSLSVDKKNLLYWAISLAGAGAVMLIPTNEVFSADLRTFLAIATWMILAVALGIFKSLFVPAFITPVLWYVSGCIPIQYAYSAWTQEILYVIIGAFVLASVLEEVGFLKRLSYWIIMKMGGSFERTYWGMFVACTVVAFITFGNSYIIVATIAYGVCKAFNLGISRASSFIVMSALCGTMSSRTFIYSPQTVGLIEAGIRTVDPSFSLAWYKYMIDMFPSIIMCIIYLLVWAKIFGLKKVAVPMGKEYFQEEYKKLGPVSSAEKKAGLVLGLLMLFLVTTPVHGLSANYGFLLMPLLFFIPGINIGTAQTIKKVDFGTIFFAASCLAIGVGGNYLGLGKVIVTYLGPILSSAGSAGAAYIIMIFGIVVNFVLTPTAMMAALPASISALAASLGVDPLSLVYPFKLSTDLIFLPYEYIPYFIFFSYGVMTMKDFIKFSSVKIVISLVLLAVVFLPWWKIVGVL